MSLLTALVTFLFLTASAAWGTTSPGGAPAATGRGIADYWWLILVVIVVAVAIWYFTRRNRTSI